MMNISEAKLKVILFIVIILSAVMFDLVVKQVAFSTLYGKPDVVVIPGFWSFRCVTNTDTGFSLTRFLDGFLDKTVKLILIVCLQLCGVAVAIYFYFHPKNFLNSWIKRLPLALIVSGGLGNVIDRIIRGYVVDYVLWYYGDFYWPVFNLADVLTVTGVALIAAFIIFSKKEKKEQTPL